LNLEQCEVRQPRAGLERKRWGFWGGLGEWWGIRFASHDVGGDMADLIVEVTKARIMVVKNRPKTGWGAERSRHEEAGDQGVA